MEYLPCFYVLVGDHNKEVKNFMKIVCNIHQNPEVPGSRRFREGEKKPQICDVIYDI